MATKEVGPIVSNVVAVLTDQAVIPFDASVAFAFALTLGGAHQLDSPAGLVAGSLYALSVRQDATGSRVLSYGALFRFPASTPPTLSTVAGELDVLLFYSDGTYLNFFEIQKAMGTVVLAPTGLTATVDETEQVTLHWTNHATDADAYEIQFFNAGWGIADTVGVVATYVDAPRVAGDYIYRVRAKRGTAYSQFSNEASGTSL